jgi:hypothetical protein
MFPFTFFTPLSNFVPFDHKYIHAANAHQAFPFLQRAMMSFFSTNQKIEAQRCSWKIIQLHTRESFGKRLAQHCPWGN